MSLDDYGQASGRDVPVVYARPGKSVTHFTHRLVLQRPDVAVLLMDRYDGPSKLHDRKVVLDHGAAALWYVFPGAWYDIGRLHDKAGNWTGWYTNLCRPVVVTDAGWEITDLFLDLWQPADGGPATWLDRDEYEVARNAGLIDVTLHGTIERVCSEIDARVVRGQWPPAETIPLDLASARRLADGMR